MVKPSLTFKSQGKWYLFFYTIKKKRETFLKEFIGTGNCVKKKGINHKGKKNKKIKLRKKTQNKKKNQEKSKKPPPGKRPGWGRKARKREEKKTGFFVCFLPRVLGGKKKRKKRKRKKRPPAPPRKAALGTNAEKGKKQAVFWLPDCEEKEKRKTPEKKGPRAE